MALEHATLLKGKRDVYSYGQHQCHDQSRDGNTPEHRAVLDDRNPRPSEPMEVMMKALGVLIVMSPLFYCAGLLLASMGLHF